MKNQTILKGLKPLFEKAEREGLWFYTSYQDLWFAPAELKQAQKEGRFVWGAVNWILRNPQERLSEFNNTERRLNHERSEFLARMNKNKN
jgi:hypothetical protein